MTDFAPSVLLIYTGVTIGMIENPETGALESFNFDHLLNFVPELKRFNYHINTYSFDPPIDSSDMEPYHWARLARIVERNYEQYDGFVILHGTDTMAYTASALSFMLENLSKPVVLTGSQLPMGMLRTDGKENLITAIEIAAAKHPDGTAMVPEGRLVVRNKTYAEDFRPIDERCGCYTCRNFSRAYIRHLIKAEEHYALRLITSHNLYFLLDLARQIRQAIAEDRFPEFREAYLANYRG